MDSLLFQHNKYPDINNGKVNNNNDEQKTTNGIVMFHLTPIPEESISALSNTSKKHFIIPNYTSHKGEDEKEGIILREKGGDDLFTILRVPLIIGACFGLIPIRGLGEVRFRPEKQKFVWFHWRTLLTLLVTSSICLHTFFMTHSFILGIISKQNSAGTLVLSFGGVWFYTVGTLVYSFFLFRSSKLCDYFHLWAQTSKTLVGLIPDSTTVRDVNLITAVILLDCLGENILYHFHAMQSDKRDRMGSLSFEEVLRDYYDSNQYIFPFFNYSWVVAMGLLVTNKLATYAWNFGDVFLMALFRALYARFTSLNATLEEALVPDGSVSLIQKGRVSWGEVRSHFHLLVKLLEEGNALVSPLIWLSYITDIFFVCRQLYEGLAPSGTDAHTLIDKVYTAWSLFHLIIRTVGVNWMAAKISEAAHKTSKILQHVYPEEYDANVRRLERYLSSRIIGISGSGCFVITRSFILMVMSAIFTLEVVLLQNAGITVGPDSLNNKS